MHETLHFGEMMNESAPMTKTLKNSSVTMIRSLRPSYVGLAEEASEDGPAATPNLPRFLAVAIKANGGAGRGEPLDGTSLLLYGQCFCVIRPASAGSMPKQTAVNRSERSS
jgi:hypothetical protein